MSLYRLKGTSGPLINQAFPLVAKLVIGRADDCDVRIDHDGVAAHHAEVLLSEDRRIRIRELGTDGGTRVNGKAVTDTELYGGDEIHLGNCRLLLQAPGLRPERVLDDSAVLVPARRWPWLLAMLLAAAVALAWQYGFLDGVLALVAA